MLFSDLYCLIYDKINRPELYKSIKSLKIYQSKGDTKDISRNLLDFEKVSNSPKDIEFDEAYYLNFYDHIFYERSIGISLLFLSAINIYVARSYLKKYLYTKYFIFMDNTRYIANNIFSIESSLIRMFLCLFGVWTILGVTFLGKSIVRNNLYILPSEKILREKYRRELLIYNNLKYSLIK